MANKFPVSVALRSAFSRPYRGAFGWRGFRWKPFDDFPNKSLECKHVAGFRRAKVGLQSSLPGLFGWDGVIYPAINRWANFNASLPERKRAYRESV
jgi:hypothetical protein